jgi:hypothetical protein
MTRTLSVVAYVGACLAVCLLLAMCGACVAFARPSPEPGPRGLTVAEERAAAMYVYVTCASGDDASGSGVLVDHDRILTAAHVVVCDDGNPPTSVRAGPRLDDIRTASVERLSIDADVAALRLETPVSDIRPASDWSSAREGSLICASTSLPERTWGCGNISALSGASGNDIDHTEPTDYGNSGAGMYDGGGRLIGIVTQCYTDSEGCSDRGGRATSVGGKEWLR